MSIDFSTITNALTTIGVLAGAGYATLPLLMWGKKLNLDALHTVATVCQQVVAGIEQTQGAQSGAVKKQLALAAVQSILTSLKVSVPEPFIDAAVEAAVLALGSSAPSAPSPPPTPPATTPPAMPS
jgi:hypothetical protein